MQQINPNNTQQILYKYLDIVGAFSLLQNHTFKLTQPNKLNDPFEFMPGGYRGDTVDERYRRAYELLFQEKYRLRLNEKKGQNYSSEEWPTVVKNFPKEEVLSLANAVFDEMQRRDWTPWVGQISQYYGITCFSKTYDNILMWSHYAAQHKGIVVGFETTNLSELHPVIYSTERCKIPLSSVCNEEARKQSMIDVMTTKEACWHYEDEWRMVHKLPSISPNGLYLLPFDSNCIKEVYIGIRTEEKERQKLIDYLQASQKMMRPKVFQMEIAPNVFSLIAKQIL